MHTALHEKIRSMCHTTRDGEGHWILRGSKTIWIPEIQQVVTTKRAAYAAFRGEVPEGKDVRAGCGVSECVAPDHAVLCEARRAARKLSLPGQLLELAKPIVFKPPSPPGTLPPGLTLPLVEQVKRLTARGNVIGQIRNATGLPVAEIVKIRGGVYDEAAKVLALAHDFRGGRERSKRAKHIVNAQDDDLRGATIVQDRGFADSSQIDEGELSSEEVAWLQQVGRG